MSLSFPGVVYRPPPMSSSALPDSLLPSLDVAALERADDGSFTLLGAAPAWLRRLWPAANANRERLRPEAAFLFLEHFFGEAVPLWNRDEEASTVSEMWTEVDAEGREWLLEATALKLEGRSLLLLKFPTVAPENYREVLQQSRELSLEHYRLQKEIDQREVLLHCIVHDLSTPLASINGSLRMLLDDALVPEEGEPLVNIGLRQTAKMRRMMREMLEAFSRRTQPGQPPATAIPDLAAAVHDLTTGLAPSATLKGVRFRVETDPPHGAGWPVVGEATRLERVLFNLLENALRHAPAESDVVIRLTDEGTSVRFSVEDAGPGVPRDEAARLFRKFAQGSGKTGQVGLGLYFCRITIEGWGGAVGYNPSPLGGACFWFRLPKPTA